MKKIYLLKTVAVRMAVTDVLLCKVTVIVNVRETVNGVNKSSQ